MRYYILLLLLFVSNIANALTPFVTLPYDPADATGSTGWNTIITSERGFSYYTVQDLTNNPGTLSPMPIVNNGYYLYRILTPPGTVNVFVGGESGDWVPGKYSAFGDLKPVECQQIISELGTKCGNQVATSGTVYFNPAALGSIATGLSDGVYVGDSHMTEPGYVYFVIGASAPFSSSISVTLQLGFTTEAKAPFEQWVADGMPAPGEDISNKYQLTIIQPSHGSITNNNTITCGTTEKVCSDSFIEGTSTNLTPIPDVGYEFNAWTGSCSGNKIPFSVSLDENKSCGASFILQNTPPSTVPDPSISVQVKNEVQATSQDEVLVELIDAGAVISTKKMSTVPGIITFTKDDGVELGVSYTVRVNNQTQLAVATVNDPEYEISFGVSSTTQTCAAQAVVPEISTDYPLVFKLENLYMAQDGSYELWLDPSSVQEQIEATYLNIDNLPASSEDKITWYIGLGQIGQEDNFECTDIKQDPDYDKLLQEGKVVPDVIRTYVLREKGCMQAIAPANIQLISTIEGQTADNEYYYIGVKQNRQFSDVIRFKSVVRELNPFTIAMYRHLETVHSDLESNFNALQEDYTSLKQQLPKLIVPTDNTDNTDGALFYLDIPQLNPPGSDSCLLDMRLKLLPHSSTQFLMEIAPDYRSGLCQDY
ncbi:InlB B-repeat-containing protein [Candidatus Venteria ishoeyi]|uniref:Bacterial repeat domain-containing protein n=1 Tax=Candidatus Venteria ishoeyi TaxID=1899563 RepID=A0A1H6F7W9_9GAMM|nr:hypothetical protein [Candidatus Venteria ishoeyi]SEH05055.1 Uncharacterised protein [Candidatus Venteria ishoeyi]